MKRSPIPCDNKEKWAVKTEVDPIRHQFSWASTVKVKLCKLQPSLNYAESRQGIIMWHLQCHQVLAKLWPGVLCDWHLMSKCEWQWALAHGATTAWGGGRSWIWNNETVNGLHHCYWFSKPWSMFYVQEHPTTLQPFTHKAGSAYMLGTCIRPTLCLMDPFSSYITFNQSDWTFY